MYCSNLQDQHLHISVLSSCHFSYMSGVCWKSEESFYHRVPHCPFQSKLAVFLLIQHPWKHYGFLSSGRPLDKRLLNRSLRDNLIYSWCLLKWLGEPRSHMHNLFSPSKWLSSHTLGLLSTVFLIITNFSIFCNPDRLKFPPNIKCSFFFTYQLFPLFISWIFTINNQRKAGCMPHFT